MKDDERPQSWTQAAVRWAIVIGIASGVSYAAVRGTDRARARAAARVLARDWSEFEGCLFGADRVGDERLAERALALAKGSGDALWPHGCARTLARISRAAAALAEDDARNAALRHAADRMESSLGEAVFWTRHVQAHRERPANWTAEFVALRREITAWGTRAGTALSAPDARAARRVARPANEPDPPPPPEPVLGGAEADVVTSASNGLGFDWVFRDRRSRYTRCGLRWIEGEHPASVRCARLALGSQGDPRDLAFIASDREAMLVASQRPPSDLRVVLTAEALESRLQVAGMSRAERDFIGIGGVVWGIHRGRFSLAIRADQGRVERDLPRDADTFWNDRALGAIDGRPTLAWLRVDRRGRASLRALDLQSGSTTAQPLGDLWRSDARGLSRCIHDGRTVWFAQNGLGHIEAFEGRATGLSRIAAIDVDGAARATPTCTSGAWGLIDHGTEGGRATLMRSEQSPARIPLGAAGAWDAALSRDGIWIADGGGSGGALRVRSLGFDGRVTRTLTPPVTFPPLSAPRSVRLSIDGGRVLVLARAEQTHAFGVLEGGLTPIAQAETEPSSPR
jgi:hypothetical protein